MVDLRRGGGAGTGDEGEERFEGERRGQELSGCL